MKCVEYLVYHVSGNLFIVHVYMYNIIVLYSSAVHLVPTRKVSLLDTHKVLFFFMYIIGKPVIKCFY